MFKLAIVNQPFVFTFLRFDCIINSHLINIAEHENFSANKYKEIQSNLVISNSLISNYHLSRSENLVPVLT